MELKSEFIRSLEEGNLANVEKYLNADPSLLLTKINYVGDLCMHYAAIDGNLELVSALAMRSSRLLNKTNQWNETALHYAAREGHRKIVQFLLREGSNFKKKCINPGDKNHGKTAFDYAKEAQKPECETEIMLYWLYDAVKNGELEVIKKTLLKFALDPNVRFYDDGFTTFHLACKYGQLKIVEFLAQESPKLLEIKTYTGFTPLMITAFHGQVAIMHFLTAKKVDLDIKSLEKSKDALDLARDNGHFACAEVLEEAYYRQNVYDFKFMSLEKIIEKGLYSLAKRRLKDDLNTKINMLPLFHAVAEQGHLSIAQLVLEKNPAWLNFKDMFNRTALFYAICNNHISMAEFLINKNIELGLNPQTLTKYDLTKYCNGSDRILNCLILRITRENPELKLVDFVYSGSQALDLMLMKPDLIKTIMEDKRIKLMIEESSLVDSKQIKFYRKHDRNRRSAYGIINTEQNTSINFQPEIFLGKGHHRTVRLFKSPDGKEIAVKSFNKTIPESEKEFVEHCWQREMKHSKQISPGNSTFALFFFDEGNGSNGRFIEPFRKGVYPGKFIAKIRCEYELANVILEIVQALQKLHAKKIVHGDIYNKNILINDKPFKVKFIDKEHSRNIEEPEAVKFAGAGQWYAPEVSSLFNPEAIKPNFSQDIYSLGVFLDTIFGEHPSFADLLNKFPCIGNFIQQAQHFNPESRPTLNYFQQELQESLSTKRLSIG